MRAIRTAVKPPNHRPGLDVITHNVILVREVNGPGDDTEICWLLVTTLPIETVEEILNVVDYYAARWTIETYFRPLVETPLKKSQVNAYAVSMETNSLVAIRKNLHQWEGPARMVWGLRDVLFGVKWAEWLDRALPGSRRI